MKDKKMYALNYLKEVDHQDFEIFETKEEAEAFALTIEKPLFLFSASFDDRDIFKKDGVWDYNRKEFKFLDFNVIKDYFINGSK